MSELLLERLPATLEFSLIAALYALRISIPMGVYSALHPTRFLTISVPDDFTEAVSPCRHLSHRYFVDLDFRRLARPAADLWPWRGCRPRLVDHWFADCKWLEIGAMSAFTLGMFQLTLIMRLVRLEMLEVLRTDYIKFARARPQQSRDQFRARPEDHFGAGHHHHRPPTWLHYRVRYHHRNCVPVAGYGPIISPGHSVRRHPRNSKLPHNDRVVLRRDQSGGRYSLSRR